MTLPICYVCGFQHDEPESTRCRQCRQLWDDPHPYPEPDPPERDHREERPRWA